jgi:prepilin-type processing-associated H-X9-DG protein
MSENENVNLPHEGQVRMQPHFHLRKWTLGCLGIIVCLLMLVSLLLPAVRSASGAALRAQCVNNLKQITLALHNYEEEYGSLPPAYIAAGDGTPMHSWRVLILPFMGESPLYESYRFDEPWNGPNNRKLAERIPGIYQCPGIERNRQRFLGHSTEALTPYVVITGEQTAFRANHAMKTSEISDGTRNTMIVVEADPQRSVPWMSPTDIDLPVFSRILNVENKEGQQHASGTNAAFADGSVRFLRNPIDRDVLRFLSTTNGGEKISAEAY